MKKVCSLLLPTVILAILTFFVNKLIQQEKVKKKVVIEMATDRIMERQEQEHKAKVDQFVREYLQDSTIQVMDYEKGILRKDSIRFFYDWEVDMFVLLPNEFSFGASPDSSMLIMKSDVGIIMIDVYNGDEATLKERYQTYLQKWMKEYEVSIKESNISNHQAYISGSVKSLSDSLQSYFFCRKWVNRDTEYDLSIYFLIFPNKRQETEKYIKTVVKMFPERPF